MRERETSKGKQGTRERVKARKTKKGKREEEKTR